MRSYNKGPDNPNWKGGASQTHVGNLYSVEGKVCNDCGTGDDIVRHHKDEDRTNNDPSNIEFLCRGCHASHHHKGKKHNLSDEGRQAISQSRIGNKDWLGRQHSPSTKLKMSESQKIAAGSRARGPDGRWTSSV